MYSLKLFYALIFLLSFEFCSGFNNARGEIKVKVDYTENPNQANFFNNKEFERYKKIGQYEKLDGSWSGRYIVSRESIFWVNPTLDDNNIYNSVDFGPYSISLKFDLIDKAILSGLEIIQKDVQYGPVKINLANDKQINYWTEARNRDWVQVVRGKIFRANENQLFTVFQTTVYENKTPIYAFRGEAFLKRL